MSPETPVYRPLTVGFEDAPNRTQTSFKVHEGGSLDIVIEDGQGRVLGVTEVDLDDLIACLEELKRRALSTEGED